LTFALLIFILTGEAFLRTFRPQKTYSTLLSLTGEQYREGEFIPFTLKPNYKAKMPSMEFPGKFVSKTTNSFGLRGKEITLDKPAGIKRILILGDSYTFGLYVGDDETYPAVLENLFLRDSEKVEVINAGYADGWSPDEHYAWLVNKGLRFKPDLVIYGFFIGNDIDGINESTWKERDKNGLPTKIINNSIYIDKFGRIRSKVKDNKTVGVEFVYKIPIIRESHLAIFFARIIETMTKKFEKQYANNGWGENPFEFILEEKSNEENSKREKLFQKLVKGMNSVAAENQAKFLLLMITINFQVDNSLLPKVIGNNNYSVKRNYFEEIKPILKENKIYYLDLLEEMRQNPSKYFPDNGEVHFNSKGHEFTANMLKETIDRMNLLK